MKATPGVAMHSDYLLYDHYWYDDGSQFGTGLLNAWQVGGAARPLHTDSTGWSNLSSDRSGE